MDPGRTSRLPSSGRAFGQLKQNQSATLDSICAEFSSQATSEQLTKYKEKFMEFDLDNSGDIDMMELKLMMEKMGQAKTHLELKRMISEVDSTGNGTINFRDFLQMMLGSKSSILQRILQFEELAARQNPAQPKKGDHPPPRSLTNLP
eukprot:TRINITY_DN1266_c0_g1_i1.p1 TRINITY_DN1266_c0_g1~~TRINITY_DN1266_c0_g1_i1.p1  ORF type:complete len:148 (+),score=75.74 TRINITY_DN1266_c0_g1_i1:89-532(+)